MGEKIVDFQVAHPGVTAAFIAVIVGFTGWNVYRMGLAHGLIRAAHAAADHAASEALGG